MSYLYSKLPETGVSPHIGTGGLQVSSQSRQATETALVVLVVPLEWYLIVQLRFLSQARIILSGAGDHHRRSIGRQSP